jgi:hypothetical protein
LPSSLGQPEIISATIFRLLILPELEPEIVVAEEKILKVPYLLSIPSESQLVWGHLSQQWKIMGHTQRRSYEKE